MVPVKGQSYPELGQLQSHLDEGIRAGLALLNQSFPKFTKQTAVEVHVICYLFGNYVRALNGLSALREGKNRIFMGNHGWHL